MPQYQHARAAPSVADDDHLAPLQDSETVARRVYHALLGHGKAPQLRGTSPAHAAPRASHCTVIMSQYHHARAAPQAADDDHLTALQDSETVARRVCQGAASRHGFEVPVGHAAPPARRTALSSCPGIITLGPHHKLQMTTTSQPYKTSKPSPEGSARPARVRQVATGSRYQSGMRRPPRVPLHCHHFLVSAR